MERKHLGTTRPPARVSDERADVCFLFRDPTEGPAERGKPLAVGRIESLWFGLLTLLEKRCFESGERLDDGTPTSFVGEGESKATLYPLHALRVSLITAYALDGSVPFPILSKLIAGHARLIMTLYYTVAGKAHVTEVMQKAERKLIRSEAISYRRFLMNATYKQIEASFAYVSEDGVLAAKAQRSPAGFVFDNKGICSAGGAMCDVGGDMIVRGKSKNRIYAPVAGFPQERNCVRCRFFLTAPAFLDGLQAHFNELSFHASECAERYVAIEGKVQMLEEERDRCEREGRLFLSDEELEKACHQHEAEAERGNKLLTDMQACLRHIERCVELSATPQQGGIRLIAAGTVKDVRYALEEVQGEIHQLEIMCQNVVFYPEIEASKAVLRRSQILDTMLQMNGRPPIFFRLTPEQQLAAGNDLMTLIGARAGSLRNAVEFAEGKRLLRELGLQDEVLVPLIDRGIPYAALARPARDVESTSGVVKNRRSDESQRVIAATESDG